MARFLDSTPTETQPTYTSPVRTNKYAAPCVDCGARVEAEQGTLTKNEQGKWEVKHVKPCPEVVAALPVVTETVTVTTGSAPSPVFDGIYTLVKDEGHQTIRIRVQDKDATFKPGVQIVGYLVGPDNEKDYQSVGEITKGGAFKVWQKHASKTDLVTDIFAILTDTEAKIDRKEILLAAKCFRCHHTLTVPTSVHDGLGPECAKKGY